MASKDSISKGESPYKVGALRGFGPGTQFSARSRFTSRSLARAPKTPSCDSLLVFFGAAGTTTSAVHADVLSPGPHAVPHSHKRHAAWVLGLSILITKNSKTLNTLTTHGLELPGISAPEA